MIQPGLYWLIIGVMLFFLELALPGFILFFFALGALITALASWLFTVSIAWQLAIFLGASLLSLFLLRNFIQQRFLDSKEEENEDRDDPNIVAEGSLGTVTVPIVPPAEGQVKCSGSFWRATANEELAVGIIVSVERKKNLVLHVARKEN